MASVAGTLKHGLHPPSHGQAVTLGSWLGGKTERTGAEACRLNFSGSSWHPGEAGRACLSENQPVRASSETTSAWVGGVRAFLGLCRGGEVGGV